MGHIDNLLYKVSPYCNRALSEFFWWAAIISGVTMTGMMYVFYQVDKNFNIPNEWKERLQTKCQSTITFMSFTNASLIEGGAVGLIIGAYFSALVFAQSPYTLKPLSEDILRLLLRVVMGLVLMLPFCIPLVMALQTTDPYIAMISFTLSPTFGLGYVLFGLLDRTMNWLCGSEKTKLVVKETI